MADTTHEVQAAVEGVDIVGGDPRVRFLGEDYRIAEKVGLMPLMKFAWASSKGTDTQDMAGLAAMYEMIRDCIDPGEWDRFQTDAVEKKAEAEDLFGVVTEVIQVLTARPSQRPSGSSTGPLTTSASSKDTSSSTGTPPTTPNRGELAELVSISDLMDARDAQARLTA